MVFGQEDLQGLWKFGSLLCCQRANRLLRFHKLHTILPRLYPSSNPCLQPSPSPPKIWVAWERSFKESMVLNWDSQAACQTLLGLLCSHRGLLRPRKHQERQNCIEIWNHHILGLISTKGHIVRWSAIPSHFAMAVYNTLSKSKIIVAGIYGPSANRNTSRFPGWSTPWNAKD